MTCLLAAASLLLGAALARAECPLAGIEPAVYNQVQSYQGAESEYVWYLSPCAMAAAPGERSCIPALGHFQQFETSGNSAAMCDMSLAEVKKPWTYFSSSETGVSGYSAIFSNRAGDRRADVTVLCDGSAGNLSPFGVAAATGTDSITWSITLKSDQACQGATTTLAPGSTAQPTPAPRCPLAGLQPAVYDQPQSYQGTESPYAWYLSPCGATAAPGEAPCMPASGYFQQFDAAVNGAGCDMSLSEVKEPWTYFSASAAGLSGYSATFGNTAGDRIAIISVLCDNSTGNLSPSGVAAATGTDSITWTVNLKSAHACQGATTPAPAQPTAAPSTGCGQFSNSGCAGCTQAPSGTCGYCLHSKTCEEGSSNGPANGACPSSDWEWYPDQCRTKCREKSK